MRIVCDTQNSPEWLLQKCGLISASRVACIMKQRKRGDGDLAEKARYRQELVTERLTQLNTPKYVSPEMQHGLDYEATAVAAYEMATGNETDSTGFVLHPNMDYAGASPDRLVGEDGLLECKCPTSVKHLEYLIGGKVPDEYRHQMMWQLACCERKWVDFVSFDPRMPEPLQLFVCRLEHDAKEIAAMEYAVMEFNAEVQAIIDNLHQHVKPTKQQFREAVEADLLVTDADIDFIEQGWAKQAEGAEF